MFVTLSLPRRIVGHGSIAPVGTATCYYTQKTMEEDEGSVPANSQNDCAAPACSVLSPKNQRGCLL